MTDPTAPPKPPADPRETLCMWQTEAADGQKITITALEVGAVKAWCEAILSYPLDECPAQERAHWEYLSAFLGKAMRDDDESIAMQIAHGRRIEMSYGERPLMAEVDLPPDDPRNAKVSRRFRRW
jgi:hypothetical protein